MRACGVDWKTWIRDKEEEPGLKWPTSLGQNETDAKLKHIRQIETAVSPLAAFTLLLSHQTLNHMQTQ